ncbi:MAG TPA: response regulator transcription factor [Povalibacter sp.]|jgi:DNA-binding response OmpR family regulator|nr:response regulator transcription factor [Povalibacter sp.]
MHLLLIEDHEDIAANIAEYFAARGDVLTHALDGPSGLALALQNPYDAIVLDLMLPGMDGIALCRNLRQAGHTRVPVLMLTAKDLLADKVEGFEAGADDYLIKPFSLIELDARLKALVRRASPPEVPRVLTVGDLKFDLNTLEAERGGERIKLNPTTRRILAMLMQHSNRVVTRAELEHELWGDRAPEGDFLRAHMHALRSAIDRNFPVKLLHTIHGTGYRLTAEP